MTKRKHNIPQPHPQGRRILVNPFTAFTTKYKGCALQLITPVRVTKAFDPVNTPPEQITIFEKEAYETRALWDTGATNSVVTEATATTMGLVPIGVGVVNHAGGSSTKNRYLLNIYLPNNVAIAGVTASDMPANSSDFGILIGMDIISKGDLSISNFNNKTWLSFRFPSYCGTDYVIESHRMAFAGVRPNQPCPCGGKDSKGQPIPFKNCHGKDL